MSAPFSLWVALDVLFVLFATVLVVYGEVQLLLKWSIPKKIPIPIMDEMLEIHVEGEGVLKCLETLTKYQDILPSYFVKRCGFLWNNPVEWCTGIYS